MEKGNTKVNYHFCTMSEVRQMIDNKQAYPVLIVKESRDGRKYQAPTGYLIERKTNEDDTMTERTFFFDHKDKESIISWIEDEYTGLFYTL